VVLPPPVPHCDGVDWYSVLLVILPGTVLLQLLALVNLRGKATHSSQTVLSHFRREADSQVWLPKAAAVQTKVGARQAENSQVDEQYKNYIERSTRTELK
jgi:hypothetical protein